MIQASKSISQCRKMTQYQYHKAWDMYVWNTYDDGDFDKYLWLAYTTPVSMRWRWSCCSLWRRSYYWWGYSGGCEGQGSSHRGHGATPSDGSRDWCLEIYVRGSMPWLLNSVRCTWNLIWQHGHSKCSKDIGPFLKKIAQPDYSMKKKRQILSFVGLVIPFYKI